MWQPQGHLTTLHSREGPCQDSSQLPHWAPWTRPAAREPVWLWKGACDNWYGVRCMYVSCKEKYPEHNVDLYTTFTDLTKAFYTVSWEDLWKIMTKFGCPEHFIKMVRQLHDGMQAQVLENSDSSTLFSVTSGVKQGYVMLPTLFSMMFAAMLTDAFQDSDPGRGIRYRTERKLFNLRCLRDKTKVHVDRLRDFLFTGRRLVDDWALNAVSPKDLQCSMDLSSTAWNNFGWHQEDSSDVSACSREDLSTKGKSPFPT